MDLLRRLEADARQRLPGAYFDFFAGGAGDEQTLGENLVAWKKLWLRPRVVVDVADVDTTCRLLGERLSLPVLLAPMSTQRLLHHDGELASARAATTAGSIYCLATRATADLAEVAAAAPGPLWFQLYLERDRVVGERVLQRAARHGYRAVVLTVDRPVGGRRERELLHGNFALPQDVRLASHLGGEQVPPAKALGEWVLSLTWPDVAWARRVSGLPVLVKGVLTAEDAIAAVQARADAIIVSNHGARQLDGCLPSAVALREVAAAVAGRAGARRQRNSRWRGCRAGASAGRQRGAHRAALRVGFGVRGRGRRTPRARGVRRRLAPYPRALRLREADRRDGRSHPARRLVKAPSPSSTPACTRPAPLTTTNAYTTSSAPRAASGTRPRLTSRRLPPGGRQPRDRRPSSARRPSSIRGRCGRSAPSSWTPIAPTSSPRVAWHRTRSTATCSCCTRSSGAHSATRSDLKPRRRPGSPAGAPSGDFRVLSPEEVDALARAARAGAHRSPPSAPLSDEIQAAYRAQDAQDAAIFVVASFAGLRLGELRALRWRDVDFSKRLIHVRRANSLKEEGAPKSGKVRAVPMIDQVLRELDALSRRDHFTGDDDLVFISPAGAHLEDSALRRRFYAALEQAKIKHPRFHEYADVFVMPTFGRSVSRVGLIAV